MCSFMTKSSHSGLMCHPSCPQTLCSSHTELLLGPVAPSPHLLAFLCAASPSKNALSRCSLPGPFSSHLCLACSHSHFRSQIGPCLPRDASSDSRFWTEMVAAPGSCCPGTPTPKRRCLSLHWTPSFLGRPPGAVTVCGCLLDYQVLAGDGVNR